MMENNVWVIVTNASSCNIYKYNKLNPHLMRLKEFEHPESKLKNLDLTYDSPGTYKKPYTGSGSHNSRERHNDPKELEKDKFVAEISHYLDRERILNSYNKLVIVSPSEVYGLINKHLKENTKKKIIESYKKDLTHLKEAELASFLNENLNFI